MGPQPQREVQEVDTCPVYNEELPTSPDDSKTAGEAHVATSIEAHLASVDQPVAHAIGPVKPQMELLKRPTSTPQPSSLPPSYEKGELSDSKRPAQPYTKRPSFLGSARRTSLFGGKLRKEQTQQSSPTLQEEEDRKSYSPLLNFLYQSTHTFIR